MSVALIPCELPREQRSIAAVYGMVRQDRRFCGRRIVLQVLDGNLLAHRYNDDYPDGIAQTIIVATNGVTGCGLTVRGCGTIDSLYCQGGRLMHAVSRNGGSTWMSTNVGEGYTLVEQWLDGGTLVAMLYSQADGSWHVRVGTLGDDNKTWQFSPARLVKAGKPVSGSLRRRPDGAWEFAYINSAGTAEIIRCRCLMLDGTGAWE